MKRKKPFIIPLFLPHAACPHHCLFCNQKTLHPESPDPVFQFDPQALRRERDRWLAFPRDEGRPLELAFYGGNFLGLQEREMAHCITLAKETEGAALRISTRPDSVDGDRLKRLRASGMPVTVELGVQSLDDRVLRRSGRGHNAASVEAALTLLRQQGFCVGVQMMLGLPGTSEASDLESARKLLSLGVDFVRVAPTLVLRGSGLERLHRKGRYQPLGFFEAVERTAAVTGILEPAGVLVLRMGLQEDASLLSSLVAGPHHPAFGEWVRGYILGEQVRLALKALGPMGQGEGAVIRSAPQLLGRLRGMKGSNLSSYSEAVFPAPFRIHGEEGQTGDFWRVDREVL